MAESFPAFLRSLERSIEPLERIAGVAPPFRDDDDVEATTAADLAFVLRDLRRAAAGARAWRRLGDAWHARRKGEREQRERVGIWHDVHMRRM